MIPWRYNQVVLAFVLSLGAVNAATEACLRARVPLQAAVLLLALAGALTFTLTFTLFYRVNVRHNRIRQASARRLRREAREFGARIQMSRAV